MDASNETRPKKQDRSTVPTLIVLVACVVFAYFQSSESALLQLGVPAGLIGIALAYALWPRLTRSGSRSS